MNEPRAGHPYRIRREHEVGDGYRCGQDATGSGLWAARSRGLRGAGGRASWAGALALLLALTLVVAGCTAVPRQAPNRQDINQQNLTGDETRNQADRISAFVRDRVRDRYDRVETILVGNVAVVGLVNNNNREQTGDNRNVNDMNADDNVGENNAGTDIDLNRRNDALGPTGPGGANTGAGGANTVPSEGTNVGTNMRANRTDGAFGPGFNGYAFNPAAANLDVLDQRTASEIMRRFPDVDRVYSTDDPEITASITQVATDVRNGRPITGRVDEIAAIVRAVSGTRTPGMPNRDMDGTPNGTPNGNRGR